MTDLCPDCGRPIAGGEESWIATGANVSTHCFGHISGDYVGRGMCKDNTIARLRLELANALSIANSRTYCMDSPEVLKARVGELERGLAEARAIGELERDLIEQTLAWQEYDRSRPPKDPGFTTVPFVRWVNAVDRVIAARAATSEPKTKPSDIKPSEWIANFEQNEECSRVDAAIAYLDERHTAGQGEPIGGFPARFAENVGKILRCEHGVPVNEACEVCGENSVQRTSAYGVASVAPVAAPPAQPEQGLVAYVRHDDGSRTPITPKQWAQAVLAHPKPAEEAKAPPAQPCDYSGMGVCRRCGQRRLYTDDSNPPCRGWPKFAPPAQPVAAEPESESAEPKTDRDLLAIWEQYAEELGATRGEFDPLLEALNQAYNAGLKATDTIPRPAPDELASQAAEPAVLVAGEPLSSNPVEPETMRGQLQWGLDCVAGALGRPSLLVGEHATAVGKVMSERDAALAQVEELTNERDTANRKLEVCHEAHATMLANWSNEQRSHGETKRALTAANTRIAELKAALERAHDANQALRSTSEVKRLEGELNSKQIHYAQLLMEVKRLEDSNAQLHRENDAALARVAELEAATRDVLIRIIRKGTIQNHGHRERPGNCTDCIALNALESLLVEPPLVATGERLCPGCGVGMVDDECSCPSGCPGPLTTTAATGERPIGVVAHGPGADPALVDACAELLEACGVEAQRELLTDVSDPPPTPATGGEGGA